MYFNVKLYLKNISLNIELPRLNVRNTACESQSCFINQVILSLSLFLSGLEDLIKFPVKKGRRLSYLNREFYHKEILIESMEKFEPVLRTRFVLPLHCSGVFRQQGIYDGPNFCLQNEISYSGYKDNRQY